MRLRDLNRSLEPEEARDTPALSMLLGYGPMLPFVAAACVAWMIDDARLPVLVRLTVAWGGAILCFFAGVRRGLSFRTPGGARVAQLASMFALFVLGLAALLLPWNLASVAALLFGYGAVAALDPPAAHRGEAPPFFARLRPWQMAVPIVSLAVLAARLLR